ncbi:MAG: DMT family transporter [Candidatus Hydrogenedentota bacterium]
MGYDHAPMARSHYPIQSARLANRRAAIEMITAAFCFATMAAIAHGFGGVAPWPSVALVRIAVTCVLMHIVVRVRGVPLVVWDKALWWRAILGTCGLLCNFYALSRLPITDVVTILATAPVWVTVILVIVFRRPMPASVWLHAGLAAAGVYVMHRPTFSAEAIPLFIACGAAVIIGAAKVALSYCAHVHPLAVVTHYATFGTLAALATTLLVHDPNVGHTDYSLGVWWWLVPMGVAGTLAQFLMTMAYGRGVTTMVAIAGISQIAFAGVYDRFVWGHTFDLWKMVGIIMIATAIALSVNANARTAREHAAAHAALQEAEAGPAEEGARP